MTPTVIKWILTFSIRECIISSVLSKISWHLFEYFVISSTFFCMCDRSLIVSSALCWVSTPLRKLEWQAIVIINFVQPPNRSLLQRFLIDSSHFWLTFTSSSWIELDKISATSLSLSSRWFTSGVLALASSRNCFTDSKLSWQIFEKSAIVSKLPYLLRDHKASWGR